MKDIVLSASSRFYPIVVALRDELVSANISVFTPDLEFVTKIVTAEQKRKLTTDFFEKIENSRVFCVVTDESGYVGRSVSMEVGFAYAKGRPIVCLQEVEDPAIRGLCTKLKGVTDLIDFVRSCG